MDLFVLVEDETIIFEKFKKVVSDLNQNDDVLIRFLRARDYDIPNSEKMLRNAVKWREATDINNYMKWKFPSNYEKDLPYRLFGKCNEGAAICWVFVGKWTTKKFVDNDEGDQVLRYQFAMMERGLRIIAESGRAGTIVLDMEGLTLSQATHIPSLKLSFNALQTVEQCYPEIAKAIYVINVPWAFSFAYNFVKSIIAPRTMEKIKIFSYKEEWQAEFLKRFPIDSIVPQLLPPSH